MAWRKYIRGKMCAACGGGGVMTGVFGGVERPGRGCGFGVLSGDWLSLGRTTGTIPRFQVVEKAPVTE